MAFIAPKFTLEPKRQAEIPFNGSCPNGQWLTLISARITYPFRILRVSMVFTDAANNLVYHYWLVAQGVGVSTTALPEGENIFGRESPTANFIGDALIKVINCNIEVLDPNRFIKFVTYNISGAAYTVNGSIIIQEM